MRVSLLDKKSSDTVKTLGQVRYISQHSGSFLET